MLLLILLDKFLPFTWGAQKGGLLFDSSSPRRVRLLTELAFEIHHEAVVGSKASSDPCSPYAVRPTAHVAVAVATGGHAPPYDYDKDDRQDDQEKNDGDQHSKYRKQPHGVVGREIRRCGRELLFGRLQGFRQEKCNAKGAP